MQLRVEAKCILYLSLQLSSTWRTDEKEFVEMQMAMQSKWETKSKGL